jgi:hypothetical protein
MNETNTATTATHNATTAAPFEVAPMAHTTAPMSHDARCDAQTAALAPYRETLAQLLPDLRAEIVEACRIRATVEACQGWSQAVLAVQLLPQVKEQLEAQGIPVDAFMAYGDEVVFGMCGGGAVGGATRAAAGERLQRESQPTRKRRRAARRKAA